MKVDVINRKRWVCKSDINKTFLDKCGLSFYSVSFVKNFVENAFVDNKYVRWFVTGNDLNNRQVRHTKFVSVEWLYKQLIKN